MRKWKTDWGLQSRMFFTMFLLFLVYMFFLVFLSFQGVGMNVMLIFIAGFMFLQFFMSDKLVLWSMKAKIVSESEEPKLHETITRLCAIADLPKPKVAVVQSSVPNAFATGRSPKKAVVAVTTGIMQALNQSELEAVLAHELSHVKNRDVMVMTIAGFLSTVAFFLVRYLLFFGGGSRNRESGGIMAAWIVSIVVWIISLILIRTLSRYREYSADRGAALITGTPSHLASALMKISSISSLRRIRRSGTGRRPVAENFAFLLPIFEVHNI
jgi:heat shock protein HtpX